MKTRASSDMRESTRRRALSAIARAKEALDSIERCVGEHQVYPLCIADLQDAVVSLYGYAVRDAALRELEAS